MKPDFIAFLAENIFGEMSPSSGGQYNGYVGIKKDINLPLSYQGVHQEDIKNPLDDFITVHGGITLDENPNSRFNFKRWAIVPLTDIPYEYWKDYRIIGFDTSHIGDNSEIWTYETVSEETMKLYNQLVKLNITMNCLK